MTENLSTLPTASPAETQSGALCQFVSETVSRYPAASAWAAGIVLLLIVLLVWRWRRNRRDFRVYNDEGGAAMVSRKALRHLIRMVCDEIGTAGSPCIRLSQKRNRVDITIALKLYQNQRLSVIHEQLRQRIRSTFEQTHGIQLGEVSLKVTGFKKSRHADNYEADFISPPAADNSSDEDLSSEGIVIASEVLIDESDSASEAKQAPEDTAAKRSFFSFGRSKKFDVAPQDIESSATEESDGDQADKK